MLDDRDWSTWTQWRFTSMPLTTFGGLHGSLIFLGPLTLLASAALGLFPFGAVLVLAYSGFLFYCARQKRTPYRQLLALYVVHVEGAQWRAR